MRLLAEAAEIALPNPSAKIIKRKGERGSACLMPLEGLMIKVGDPLSQIEKKALKTRAMIQVMISLLNPKEFSVCRI